METALAQLLSSNVTFKITALYIMSISLSVKIPYVTNVLLKN